MIRVALVDYGAGNLASVRKARMNSASRSVTPRSATFLPRIVRSFGYDMLSLPRSPPASHRRDDFLGPDDEIGMRGMPCGPVGERAFDVA